MFFLFSNKVAVNFENVTSIKKVENRIIINYNYSTIKNNNRYPDYLYVNDYKEEDLLFFDSDWFKKDFIKVNDYYLNKNSISSIKYEPESNKIIYNIALSRTHVFKKPSANQKVDSSIFYYELGTYEKYLSIINSL